MAKKNKKKHNCSISPKVFLKRGKSDWLLVWLAKKQAPEAGFAVIRETKNTLLTDPNDINQCFVSYYKNLYMSKVDYELTDLTNILNNYIGGLGMGTFKVPESR